MKKKVQFTEKQIRLITEQELNRIKKEDFNKLNSFIGDESEHKIEYPTEETSEEITNKRKKAPEGLLNYITSLNDAEDDLGRLAAKEHDEEMKKLIFTFINKTQKLKNDCMMSFNIAK